MLLYAPITDTKLADFKKYLALASSLGGKRVVLWKLGGSKSQNDKEKVFTSRLAKFKKSIEMIERVTCYQDDQDLYIQSDVYNLDDYMTKILADSYEYLEEILDSISIYKEGENQWFMCLILHERMLLFKQLKINELNLLKENEIQLSDIPPDWW